MTAHSTIKESNVLSTLKTREELPNQSAAVDLLQRGNSGNAPVQKNHNCEVATAVPIYSKSCPSILKSTVEAIISPTRLAALEACDVSPMLYEPYNFFSYMPTLHGRNFSMIITPLFVLLLWGLAWQIFFLYALGGDARFGTLYAEEFGTPTNDFQVVIASLQALIDPLVTPISFMMTFRMARAAVRYWDARQAAGNMVELCRSNISTVSVGLMTPIRTRKNKQTMCQARGASSIVRKSNGVQTAKNLAGLNYDSTEFLGNHATTRTEGSIENEDDAALELLCEYAKWLAVFPVAVKHFLRPPKRRNWDMESYRKKRRYEIGPLLADDEARPVLMECDDEKGNLAWTFQDGAGKLTRTRDPPLVVLSRLQELANDIAYFDHSCDKPGNSSFDPNAVRESITPSAQASLYQQINEQLNTIYGAYGAMERIKGTPLPFAYTIHLRTFLMVYLTLWNMTSVAYYGWIALPCLFASNWALLGIEAAAVECEEPFDRNRNHLTLGKFAVVSARSIAQALKEVRW